MNVVTPFTRRNKPKVQTVPRHRREGWFDDKDQWHDADEHTEASTNASH